jgi:hypothetical protein
MKLLFSFINVSLYGIQGMIFSKKYGLKMTNDKKYPLSRPFQKKYPHSSLYYDKYIERLNAKNIINSTEYENNEMDNKNRIKELTDKYFQKKQKTYPHSSLYYEKYVKRLNERNITDEINNITSQMDEVMNDFIGNLTENVNEKKNRMKNRVKKKNMRIIINGPSSNELFNQLFGDQLNKEEDYDGDYNELEDDFYEKAKTTTGFGNKNGGRGGKKSEHFEVTNDFMTNFSNVGGYDSIKKEL